LHADSRLLALDLEPAVEEAGNQGAAARLQPEQQQHQLQREHLGLIET
jgi:hypothetical protein